MSENNCPEALALGVKIESLKALPEFTTAVEDTCDFMVGEGFAEEVLAGARQKAAAETVRLAGLGEEPPKLWPLKLMYQAYQEGLILTDADYAKIYRRFSGVLNGTIHADAAQRINVPEQDIFMREAMKGAGGLILEHAYKVLGEDIDAVAEEIAATVDEQDKVDKMIQTLGERLFRLESKAPSAEENEKLLKAESGRQINHILKLSPKHIGVQPEHSFRPSCLAASMISASFLRKCGIEKMMHCSPPSRGDVQYGVVLHNIASDLHDDMALNGEPYPDMHRQQLLKLEAETDQAIFDYDPHSALIFRANEGWIYLDIYGGNVTLVGRSANTKALDETYEMVEANPGLDVVSHPDLGLEVLSEAITFEMYYNYMRKRLPDSKRWAKALDLAVAFNSEEPLLQLLDSLDREIFPSGFNEFIIASGLPANVAEKLFDEHREVEADEILSMEGGLEDKVKEFINQSLANHVFHIKNYDEDQIKGLLQRCKTDPRYLQRRREDLLFWPHKLFMRGVMQIARDRFDPEAGGVGHYPPSTLEIGQLEHRIGASALLEVSYGLGEPLPLSFWARQTSSQLPWLYHAQTTGGNVDTPLDSELSEQLRQAIEVDTSCYSPIRGIISKS